MTQHSRPSRLLLAAVLGLGLVATAVPSGAAPREPQASGVLPSFDTTAAQSLGGSGIESTGVHSMTQGDFNGDGVEDLAATAFGGINTSTTTGIAVFLGDGDASYRAPVEYPAGLYPIDITTARLRGPGFPLDLVVADAGMLPGNKYEISVLLGNGDGTFAAPISAQLPAGTIQVVSADFNGDRKDDVAVSTSSVSTTTGTRTPEELTIFIGKGDGTFLPPVNYEAASGVSVYYDMAVGDFNNDGAVDVIGMDPEGLWVSLNEGDGVFAPAALAWADPSTYLGGQDLGGPTAIAVGDLDGDGNLDAVLDVDGARVDVLLGTGTGVLRPAPVPTYRIVDKQAGQGSGTIRIVDLTGDHKADLVVSTGYGATLVVLPGAGDGTFGSPAIYPLPSTDDRNLAISDVNRDGLLDLTTPTAGGFYGSPNYLTVMLNQGQGRFLAPHQYSILAPYNSQTVTSTNPVGLTLTDLNGDGAADLVVTLWDLPTEPLANGQLPEPPAVDVANARADTHGSIAVMLGDGHGGFLPEQQYFVGARPIAVAGADLDGDGKRDVAVVNGYSGTLSVLKGNGDGTLQPAVTTALGASPNSLAVADFNADGKPDLAIGRFEAGEVSVLLNRSTVGVLALAPPVSYPAGVGTAAIVAADLTGDGIVDLATANSGSSYQPTAPSTVSVLAGRGDGTFSAAHNTTVWKAAGADAIAVGDFGGGTAVAVANFANNQVLVLRPDSTGGVAPASGPYFVGAGPESLAVADFNRDGYADIAVDSINDNTVSVLAGQGDATFRPVLRPGNGEPTAFGWAAFAYPTYLALGDLNRDGRPDLVTGNIFDATVTVLQNTTPAAEACREPGHSDRSHGQGPPCPRGGQD